MTLLASPALYDSVNVAATQWPSVTVGAGVLALIFLVPIASDLSRSAVLKAIATILFSISMITFGVHSSSLPENSFDGKTKTAALTATTAIKNEVQNKYALEILEENIFETSKTKEGFSTITDTHIKPTTKVLHSSGAVIDVAITVTEDRTEVTVSNP